MKKTEPNKNTTLKANTMAYYDFMKEPIAPVPQRLMAKMKGLIWVAPRLTNTHVWFGFKREKLELICTPNEFGQRDPVAAASLFLYIYDRQKPNENPSIIVTRGGNAKDWTFEWDCDDDCMYVWLEKNLNMRRTFFADLEQMEPTARLKALGI